MPKARSALLASASGSLKDSLTFRALPQQPDIIMQQRPVPTDRRTAKQAAIRNAYSRLAYLWKNLSYLDKEPYQIMAEARNLTPWNCWLSFHLPIMRRSPLLYFPFPEGAGSTTQNFALDGTAADIDYMAWTERNQFPILEINDTYSCIRSQDHSSLSNLNKFSFYMLVNISHVSTRFQDILVLNDWDTYPDYGYIYMDSEYLYFDIINNDDFMFEVHTPIPDNFKGLTSIAFNLDDYNSEYYINGVKTESSTDGIFSPLPVYDVSLLGCPYEDYPVVSPVHIISLFPSTLTQPEIRAFDAYYKPFFT